MRVRFVLAFVLMCAGLSISVGTTEAAKTPRCYGKVATQWLTEPGTLLGTPGNDVLVGSSGNDTIDAVFQNNEGGIDLICGGKGDDTIYIAGPLYTTGSKADGGSGRDSVSAYATAVAHGGSGDDFQVVAQGRYGAVAYGDSGIDVVRAADGGTVYGGSGNDIVENISTTGIGHLYGGSGNDTLYGYFTVDSYMDCGSGFDTVTPTGSTHVKDCEVVN